MRVTGQHRRDHRHCTQSHYRQPQPGRIVVGADSERAATILSRIYLPLTTGSYYKQSGAIGGFRNLTEPPPLLMTSTKSAEIIKHASNAFLAMKISFINAVSNLCEATNANVEQVARGMGLDSRIGRRFLRPGIGYGGSCFPKDVAAFRSVAEQLGIDFNLLTEVEKINTQQKRRFLNKVRSALWTLRGKRIGVLGLAFKGETDDIRESPAIDVVEMLLAEGCSIVAYDPAAIRRTQEVLPAGPNLRYVADAYAAASAAQPGLDRLDARAVRGALGGLDRSAALGSAAAPRDRAPLAGVAVWLRSVCPGSSPVASRGL